MIVIQLLFSTTLQAFQVSKVKGAIRIYLLFDFLSVFAINTGLFFRIKDNKEHMEKLHNILGFKSNMESVQFDAHALSVSFLIEDIHQFFVDLRKVFLMMIVNDAYTMLCQPFRFKEYLESKSTIKRNLVAVGFWFVFHALHLISVAILVIFMLTQQNYIFLFIRKLGWKWSKHVFVFLYDSALLYFGTVRCWAMRATLHEMDQNEFAKNGHCDSLFKMSLIFCLLTGISLTRDILNPVGEFAITKVQYGVYLELIKASFDTFFSIIIMITFVIYFPGLRPRLNTNNAG